MTDQQKSPITRGDVEEGKGGVAGAHGNEKDKSPTGTSGVSGTRRDPDRIKPSEDVDK